MTFIPTIPSIQRTNVGGAWIKTLAGMMNFNADVLAVQSLRKNIIGWNPTQPSDIPFPWPASYIAKGQPFSAYTFARNLIGLGALIPVEGMSTRISDAMQYLMAQLTAYTDSQHRIIYTFNYAVDGNIYIAPWHSALANAQAMQGLLEFWRVTQDIQYLTHARNLRIPLLLTGGINTPLTLVDNASWLWFEEYPSVASVPTHVLNGHVGAVFGLYFDRQTTNDISLDNYIRAGIATACRYYWQARVPGDIIRYWIFNDTVPDYGPLRAINFVDMMNLILPNPKLAELADALRTDMRIDS